MRNATILIVEDDALLAMNLRRMISLMGYTVAGTHATGEGTLAFLSKNSVDLVLMDIELAGTMDGITAAKTINQTFGIPTVFLTSYSSDFLLEQAKTALPYGYLIKPVAERELTVALDMCLHRSRFDRELKESRENYLRIFENKMTAICVFDVETLQIVEINDTFVRLYGYSREELLGGMKIPDLNTEKELSSDGIRLEKSNESFFIPLRYHLKKDGTIFPVEIVGSTYLRDGRLVMYGMIKDISQRKLAEDELLKNQRELEHEVRKRTSDLEKTNATLAMMLDYARKTEADIQERVVGNSRHNLMSVVDMLKNQQPGQSSKDLLELLERTTLNLAHPIARNIESQLLKLSTREIQLANFIRLGKSTKELMELLNLSANTVGTHRNNLRKKLGLSNKKINLRTYLSTQFAK